MGRGLMVNVNNKVKYAKEGRFSKNKPTEINEDKLMVPVEFKVK